MTQTDAESSVRAFVCVAFEWSPAWIGNTSEHMMRHSVRNSLAQLAYIRIRSLTSIDWEAQLEADNRKSNRNWSALTCWTRQVKDMRSYWVFSKIKRIIFITRITTVEVSCDTIIFKWFIVTAKLPIRLFFFHLIAEFDSIFDLYYLKFDKLIEFHSILWFQNKYRLTLSVKTTPIFSVSDIILFRNNCEFVFRFPELAKMSERVPAKGNILGSKYSNDNMVIKVREVSFIKSATICFTIVNIRVHFYEKDISRCFTVTKSNYQIQDYMQKSDYCFIFNSFTLSNTAPTTLWFKYLQSLSLIMFESKSGFCKWIKLELCVGSFCASK